MSAATSPTPKPMNVTVTEDQPYQVTLTFNHKAQLTDIAKPNDMSTPLAIEHLAVGLQFLAKKVGDKNYGTTL